MSWKEFSSTLLDFFRQKDTRKIEVEPYSDFVKHLADNKSDVIIPNSESKHAQAIISNLFLHAEKEVCILSSDLKESIYEKIYQENDSLAQTENGSLNLHESLTAFLEKPETQLLIILQGSRPGKVQSQDNNLESLQDVYKLHDFAVKCVDYTKRPHESIPEAMKCVIYKANEEDQKIVQHFITMDKDGYRYCEDRDSEKAIASFNQPETADHLRTQFEYLKNRARQLEEIS